MILILRLFHIVLGACWVGAVVAFAFFIEPAIRAAGAAGGAVMFQLLTRKFNQAMAATAGLTVLTGLGLFGLDARAGGGSWSRTPVGIGFSVGGLAAIAAMLIGLTVMRPTVEKIGALMAAGGPPSPEVGALMDRAAKFGRIVAVLLLIAVAAMATARYL